jgi:ABC-type proline/glycine betaine transport system substrate-binding protein/ABC-type amino acid transport substrate-binding protein
MGARSARAMSALAALVIGLLAVPMATAQEEGEDPPIVRMARATWDTGWFQAEIYSQLFNRLGYRVEGPVTMENSEFYEAVAAGETDLWVNGWFPLHESLIEGDDPVELVGTQVDSGALQGYFVDIASADRLGMTNIGDLADPGIASEYDIDGNGLADLIGCNIEWTCAETIDHHLSEYGLTETVEHIQGDYSPLMRETIERYRAGEPVLYYTFTPNWTVGELVPGQDVNWLETPYPSLPEGQSGEDRTEVGGLSGCADDPCQTGWPPNDIRAVANSEFLAENPSLRALLEQVKISLTDIHDQNARMVDGEGDAQDIRRQAQEWIAANEATVIEWIDNADPDADPVHPDGEVTGAIGGTLRVAVRELAPFVIYENRTYSGFEIELAELLGTHLGSEVEFYAVDTVAKQIDDVSRGAADLAMGGVAITQSREEKVNFSLPVLDAGLTILVSTTANQSLWSQVKGFFQTIANSDLPWLLVIFGFAVLISAHLIWLTERHNNPDFAESYLRGIWDSLYWSIVTMSTVGYGDKVARGNRGRILALVWITAGTLVFATFMAAIASALAVEEIRGDISGPSDLPGNQVATVSGSAGQAYLSSRGIGPVLVENVEETYVLLDDGTVDAVVFDAPVLHFHATREGQGTVATVGPDFENVQYGIAVASEESQLRENINLALLEIIEGGAYEQIHSKWFGSLTG